MGIFVRLIIKLVILKIITNLFLEIDVVVLVACHMSNILTRVRENKKYKTSNNNITLSNQINLYI